MTHTHVSQDIFTIMGVAFLPYDIVYMVIRQNFSIQYFQGQKSSYNKSYRRLCRLCHSLLSNPPEGHISHKFSPIFSLIATMPLILRTVAFLLLIEHKLYLEHKKRTCGLCRLDNICEGLISPPFGKIAFGLHKILGLKKGY